MSTPHVNFNRVGLVLVDGEEIGSYFWAHDHYRLTTHAKDVFTAPRLSELKDHALRVYRALRQET